MPNFNQAIRTVSNKVFMLLDPLGIHVLPKHYYTPLPDYTALRRNEELWTGRCRLTGVDWDIDRQLEWLTKTCAPYYREVAGLAFYEEGVRRRWGPGFGPIESQVLHCVVREHAPGRIVEIGSGLSTACMLHAVEFNAREGKRVSEIVCIEPFPKPAFQELGNKVKHIQQQCQAVPDSVWSGLSEGDMLFIDSSHAVKVGSDVNKIYLDILPSLPPGVLVHIHDVYLPYLYQPDILTNYFGWQETVLLLALLTNNPRLQALCSLAALHHDRSDAMAKLLTDYRPQPQREGLYADFAPDKHFPSSMWLRTR